MNCVIVQFCFRLFVGKKIPSLIVLKRRHSSFSRQGLPKFAGYPKGRERKGKEGKGREPYALPSAITLHITSNTRPSALVWDANIQITANASVW